MKQIRKKVFVLFLALAMVFTSMPVSNLTGGGSAADAATKGSTSYGGTVKETQMSGYTYKHRRYTQVYVGNYQNHTVYKDSFIPLYDSMTRYEITNSSGQDFLVFCMEHGVSVKNQNGKLVLHAMTEDGSDFYSAYTPKYQYAINNMYSVLMFAPVTNVDNGKLCAMSELYDDLGFQKSKYYGQNGSSYTWSDWIAAVQSLIWECQQDMRDDVFAKKANGLSYLDSYQGNPVGKIKISELSQNLEGKPAIDIYNFIASEVKARMKAKGALWSDDESAPTKVSVKKREGGQITGEKKAGSNTDDWMVVDKDGKEVKGVKITFDSASKKYTVAVTDESLIGKTLTVQRNDGAAKRAAKYLAKSKKYRHLFWEHKTENGHTQGYISGLQDPKEFYLKLTTDVPEEPEEPGTCEPPDVEKFPTVYMPVEKIDANTGYDGDHHTPMGDAGLDAAYTLQRQIAGGGWETIDSCTLDELGSQHTFQDQPFASAEELKGYLTESGSLSACDHPITDADGNITGYQHVGSKAPTKRVWDVTVNYRITETRPDGRYIDPDKYASIREYTFTYHAESEDTCQYWCHSDPWTDIEYTFTYGATTGDGSTYTEGPSADPSEDLNCDLETFVNDGFRGEIQIIKSNEKENPFKDSAMGGGNSNISNASFWTIRLKSKGFEGQEYLHLVSEKPEVLPGGTYQYTASRSPGVPNNTLNGGLGMRVGTNGTLIIKDVPYGKYIVEERKADDPMYVLEQFEVVVAEHNGDSTGSSAPGLGEKGAVPDTGSYNGYSKAGTNAIGSVSTGTGDYYNNRYDANLRDKIKTNVIQLQKVDSETGKKIPLKGTKVYLRYKGNPDYTDEENRKRYGANGTEAKNIYNRFLPNAEFINSASTNYTFELDENGCFTIPYELPYGKYEICEWLLPDGYYVGWYDEDGKGHTHDFGMIEEGDFVLGDIEAGHSFADTVAIYDKKGNRVTYQDADKYSFESLKKMVINRYTFKVEKQEDHLDGNFTQLVTFDGKRSDADPTYDKGDYPYTKYYKVAAVINNAVKGRITVEKLGEELVGWEKVVKDGYEVLKPVFEKVSKLKDAVFGIFAAKDETLNDGSEGPAIYDAETDELITIPKTKSTNTSNLIDKVVAFFGKLVNPKAYEAADYETGEYSHGSGAELWYMLERAVSEGNVKRTLYVSPEQKDTEYRYVYETTDGQLNYRWDVEVAMSSKAGGQNVTDVNITKTTSVADGCTDDIPLTEMTGSVGGSILDPIRNYIPADQDDPTNGDISSQLNVLSGAYRFEADGEVALYQDGTKASDNLFTFEDDVQVDFSQYCPDRYMVKDYTYYGLTKADLKTEERVVGTEEVLKTEGIDTNGDGDFDDPEDTPPVYETVDVKETKTIFEWDNDVEFASTPAAGGRAIVKGAEDGTYRAAVKGYHAAGEYTKLSDTFVFIETDGEGEPLPEYTIPEGWSRMPFTGDPKEDPQYVIITQVDEITGETAYQVLLDNPASWQTCQMDGNFVKAVVQTYSVSYVQEKGDPDGLTVNWDGFALGAGVDQEDGTATTVVTKQANPMGSEVIDVGLGYVYDDKGDTITFHTVPIKAPIYFKTESGIKTEMYYKGGVALTTITLPESAVKYSYEKVVPTLDFAQTGADGESYTKNLDWYSDLTPEDPEKVFDIKNGLPTGVRVTAKRIDSAQAGGKAYYRLEIVTDQTEEAPLRLTFADGYTMDVYTAKAASGNGVGVIDLYNIYKTNRYTATDLVETITTNKDGFAQSGLLPLGDYIVRELASDDNYVNEGKDKLVSLKYKDQFTPLLWGDTKFDNKYMSVQLDMSKVFETAFKSGEYQPPKEGQQVRFGLYAAEDITAKAEGKKKDLTKTIRKDSLIDVITIDHTNQGIVTVDQKLPEGAYYLKEIEAPEDYLMSEVKYHFAVREDEGDYSQSTTFNYTAKDGVFGKFVLEEKGHVKTQIAVEARYPMPSITIDGTEYPLTEDFAVKTADDRDYISIDADADFTEIFIETYKGAPTDITLPNGKALKIEADDNTFDYTVDGEVHTYVPTVTYTGYYGGYEELWHGVKGEDLNTYNTEFTLTGAGSDQDNVIIKAAMTHTPSVTVTTEEVLIDPDKPELGYETKEVTKGNLTLGRNQIFAHSAIVTVRNSEDINVIAGTYTRTFGKKAVTETLPESGEILLNPKDTLTLQTAGGAVVTVSMDKYGNVKASVENTLYDFFTDTENCVVTSTGTAADKVKETYEFAKNAALGRQDTSADKLMIKVNSDNQDAFAIENDHKPYVELVKVDQADHSKTLAGATFEIYSAKMTGEWTTEPGSLLGTYTTGADGKLGLTLDYGVYFYREISAPSGYQLDTSYHKFRVVKAEDPYQIMVENVKGPDTPTTPVTPVTPPDTPDTPDEPDTPDTPIEEPDVPLIPAKPEEPVIEEPEVPKAGKSEAPAKVPKTGDETPILPYALLLLFGGSSAVKLCFKRKKGEKQEEGE